MLRQSSSRSHRSRKLGPSHTVQALLLIAVAVWIVYQLAHYSYGGRRRAVAVVETGGRDDGEPARPRLGRRGFLDSSAAHASGSGDGVADWADDPLSSGDGEGDDEEQEPDEDDGGDGDGADADDGLAADEEEDDDRGGFQSQNGSGSEGEAKTVYGGVNGADTVQDGAAVLMLNATAGAADGAAPTRSGSAALKLKNTSSLDPSSLHARGTAGDFVISFTVGAPGAENEKPVSAGENRNHQFNKNGTAGSVAGHGISS
ncbi:hypothetical protein BS78_01G065700 [Paspalum vaginatum]|nr:hypothetical protein BS78_01G065700 [Paspalum vaginatum]